jgi:hypothetical protein
MRVGVTYYWADDGALILNGRLTSKDFVIAALERDRTRNHAAQRADAGGTWLDGEMNHHRLRCTFPRKLGVVISMNPPEIEDASVGARHGAAIGM